MATARGGEGGKYEGEAESSHQNIRARWSFRGRKPYGLFARRPNRFARTTLKRSRPAGCRTDTAIPKTVTPMPLVRTVISLLVFGASSVPAQVGSAVGAERPRITAAQMRDDIAV